MKSDKCRPKSSQPDQQQLREQQNLYLKAAANAPPGAKSHSKDLGNVSNCFKVIIRAGRKKENSGKEYFWLFMNHDMHNDLK